MKLSVGIMPLETSPDSLLIVRFKVLTAVIMKMTAF
jgi:hypothetical protein